jgi:hypothetical protein
MTTADFPYQDYVQERVTMTPEKFGWMGSFMRSTLRAEEASDQYRAAMFDQLLVRFTAQVMSGRTVSERPEVTFTYYTPDTWWDHVKKALWDWRDKQNRRWEGTGYDGQPDTPPPWMILLWPFLALFPKWGRRYPPRTTPKIARTNVDFKQSVLYPELDHIPPEFGRPVIYETLTMPGAGLGYSVGAGVSRFLTRYEIMNEFMRDPDSAWYDNSLGSTAHPVKFMDWLERKGVNPDQLVKRR